MYGWVIMRLTSYNVHKCKLKGMSFNVLTVHITMLLAKTSFIDFLVMLLSTDSFEFC